MSVKLPDIELKRSGTDLLVTLLNFEGGDTWNVYLGDDYISTLAKVVSDHDQQVATLSGKDPEKSYVVAVSLNNAPLTFSVTVLEDHSDEAPPYVRVEAKGDTVLTPITITKAVSWGSDLTDLAFIEGENFVIEWERSAPRISIGKNKSL